MKKLNMAIAVCLAMSLYSCNNKAEEKVGLENKNLSTVKKDMKQNKESDGIDDIIDEVVELQYKEKEILYIHTENNKQRVFVPIEDK